jgi:hypothetical protein
VVAEERVGGREEGKEEDEEDVEEEEEEEEREVELRRQRWRPNISLLMNKRAKVAPSKRMFDDTTMHEQVLQEDWIRMEPELRRMVVEDFDECDEEYDEILLDDDGWREEVAEREEDQETTMPTVLLDIRFTLRRHFSSLVALWNAYTLRCPREPARDWSSLVWD